MKIIFASKFYYRRGGLESYLFKTKELLEAHGHEVIPFSTNFKLNYESKYSDFFCTYYNLSRQGYTKRLSLFRNLKATRNMFFNKEAYGAMRGLIEKTKPDFVQGFGVTKHLSYSIFKAAKDSGVPTVMRLSDFALMCPNSTAADFSGKLCPEIICSRHNVINILKNKCIHGSRIASIIGALEVNFHLLAETYKKYVDYFIAPSKFLRDTFIKRYGISPERIVYIPIFEVPEENLSDSADEGYFVFAGRLSDEKGVMTLLKAHRKNKNSKLVVAGTGPQEENYKKYVRENKLNVDFMGHIDHIRLKNIIRNCRAIIVPSECYENSPNIVLEGYSYRKPVIGSRIGGIPELIEDNKSGLLYETGSVDDLAEKMNVLHNEMRLAEEMGEHGHGLIKNKYTSEEHYKNLAKFYGTVIKKKVLLVNNFYYNRGGDCTYLFGLKTLLESKGHNVVIFSMHHPKNFSSRWSKYFVDYIDYDHEVKEINLSSILKVISRTIFFYDAKRKLAKLLREEKPDIAHLQNIHHHITPSILYSLRKKKVPVIWTLHDYQLICPNISFLANGKICERCRKNKYYWPPIIRCKKGSFAASLMSSVEIVIHNILGISRLVDTFISPSLFLKNKFNEYGFDKKKIVHVPHFADFDMPLEIKSPDNYYLYVGRLSKEKGLMTLVNAAVKLAGNSKTGKRNKLKIVGSGPFEDELTSYASSVDKNNMLEFIGHVSNEEVYEFYRKCKFVVVPSEWYENFPYAILEAFASGKPVIGAKVGGIPELVIDGETGLTYEMGNIDELSSKIKFLLDHPDKTEKMGENAKVFADKVLNVDAHYQAILKIYNDAFSKMLSK